ncbi:hypothetical protein [Thalassoroseus pseudoceratinae]|uniref:hypothetical protein n=1 Tax=Thalassoroseus pseudoceratinae TaxID=2713176 RepID=UPI00141DCDAD|nr:hypothetical protein [Thalassoroseus pseudoceratinae]
MVRSDLWTNLRRWAWSGVGLAGMAVLSTGPMTSSALGGDTKSCAATCIPQSAVQNGKVSCATTAIPYVGTTAPGKNSCADVCVPPARVTVGTKGSCTDVCIPSSCVTHAAIANPSLLPVSTIKQTAAVKPQQPFQPKSTAPAVTETKVKTAAAVDVDPFADWLPAGAKSHKPAPPKTADLFDLPTKSVPEKTAATNAPSKPVEVKQPQKTVKPLNVCLVALRLEKRLVPTNKAYSTDHGSKTYHFSSAQALAEFKSNPEAYVPVADGHDVVTQAGHQTATPGSVEHALWFRNRLYLFANAANATRFFNNPAQYAVTR